MVDAEAVTGKHPVSHPCSRRGRKLAATARLALAAATSACRVPLAFLLPLILALASCAPPGAPVNIQNTPAPSADEQLLQQNRKIIRRLADEALMALAIHHYRQFAEYISLNPSARLGRQAARRLLGENFSTAVLNRWDARQFQISFTDDNRRATVLVNIAVSSHPNRKPRTIPLILQFRYLPARQRWLLEIP